MFYVLNDLILACQSADAQRDTASQTMELIKVVLFNVHGDYSLLVSF